MTAAHGFKASERERQAKLRSTTRRKTAGWLLLVFRARDLSLPLGKSGETPSRASWSRSRTTTL